MGVTQLGSLKKEVNGVLKENDMLEVELPGSGCHVETSNRRTGAF